MNRLHYAVVLVFVLFIAACQKSNDAPVKQTIKQVIPGNRPDSSVSSPIFSPYTDTFVGKEIYSNMWCDAMMEFYDSVNTFFLVTYISKTQIRFSGVVGNQSDRFFSDSFYFSSNGTNVFDSTLYEQGDEGSRISFTLRSDSLIMVRNQWSPCFCQISNIFNGKKQ